MKILVVSLLRLGDFIQQIPLIRNLAERYPNAQIHLLLNKEFSQVEGLDISDIAKYHYFNRQGIQGLIGEASSNILAPFDEVKEFVRSLQNEKFDLVFNFTHTKLSAYLVGTLNSEVLGLTYSKSKFSGLENPWLKYFNDRFSGPQKSVFHYSEVLSFAFGFEPQFSKIDSAVYQGNKLILLQCLTSDMKKNWGLSRFKLLQKNLKSQLPEYDVKVICADFEKQRLIEHFAESDLLVCDLSGAKGHLKKARVLITGDTSIKHLAADLGIPTVELSLGSSDFIKTRAFSAVNVGLQAKVPCAPCSHKASCSQKSHICAESIEVTVVAKAVTEILNGNSKDYQRIFTAEDLELSLYRKVWQQYLDPSLNSSAVFADLNVRRSLNIEINVKFTEILGLLQQQFLQLLPLRAQSKIETSDISSLILVAQKILKDEQAVQSGYFTAFIEALTTSFKTPEEFFNKVQLAIDTLDRLLKIQNEILSSFDVDQNKGCSHEKNIGRLSENSLGRLRDSTIRAGEDADL